MLPDTKGIFRDPNLSPTQAVNAITSQKMTRTRKTDLTHVHLWSKQAQRRLGDSKAKTVLPNCVNHGLWHFGCRESIPSSSRSPDLSTSEKGRTGTT